MAAIITLNLTVKESILVAKAMNVVSNSKDEVIRSIALQILSRILSETKKLNKGG